MTNVFIVRDAIHECILTFDDVRRADEIFLSGNMSKVTPVSEFDGTKYPHGPVTKRIRALYMDRGISAG